FHVAEDADVVLGKQLLGDGCRRHTAERLAGTGSAAAAVIAEAVLRIERVISVTGAVLVLDIGVVLAALVLVAKENTDRGAVGLAFEDAGPNLGHVLFFSLANDLGLARTP